MKAVIVSGGKAPSKELLFHEIKDADIIIGADKGCETLYKFNISPDYILGDFDSIDIDIIDKIEIEDSKKLKFKKEKDFTDTEIAFNLAIENKADEIILLGATGTRYDHSLSNIGLLLKGLNLNKDVKIKDNNNTIFLINKSISLKGNIGQIISFYAYCNIVRNLTLNGCKYNLENYDLKLGDGLITSNEFLKDEINVTFDEGNLLIIYSND